MIFAVFLRVLPARPRENNGNEFLFNCFEKSSNEDAK
jgi:hypothetical protein